MSIINGNGHSNGNGHGNGGGWWDTLSGRSRKTAADVAAYRRLVLQLHYDLPRDAGTRSLLVLTPVAARDGAAGSLNLARSMGAELHTPVVLIDACPDKKNTTGMLNCGNVPGWTDLLQDPKLAFQDLVLPTSSENVSFLPAGKKASSASSPEALQRRLKQAQEQYDFVLMSGGAVLGDFPGMALVPHVGSVLLLVTENETRTDDLKAAEEALALCRAQNVRLVLASPSPLARGAWRS